jgi:hypothetical protein
VVEALLPSACAYVCFPLATRKHEKRFTGTRRSTTKDHPNCRSADFRSEGGSRRFMRRKRACVAPQWTCRAATPG